MVRGHIPQLNLLVIGATDGMHSRGGERGRAHPVGVALEGALELAGGEAPDLLIDRIER